MIFKKFIIKHKINKLAKNNGFNVSKYADKIIMLKLRQKDWRDCPCDSSNPERFCCSQLCQSDVRAKGRCHCNLFERN